MFTLLKGFSTKTIAIVVGVVIAVLLASSVFFYKSNKKAILENGSLKTENVIMQQNEDFMEKSSVITDQIVSDFVTETRESNNVTEKLRKESIHEYVKKVEPTKQVEPERVDPAVGAERVAGLANSMHENYCRARPKDAICNTESANK